MGVQVWNHPWVLKLDEDRRIEREERRRLFEESDDGGSLDGFIVSGSEEEEEEEGGRWDEREGMDVGNVINGKRRSRGRKSQTVSELRALFSNSLHYVCLHHIVF